MKIFLFLILVLWSGVCLAQNFTKVPRGKILNDAEPWFIQMEDGERYGCLRLAGSESFTEGDSVALVVIPKHVSFMMGVASGSSAQVYCVDFGKK